MHKRSRRIRLLLPLFVVASCLLTLSAVAQTVHRNHNCFEFVGENCVSLRINSPTDGLEEVAVVGGGFNEGGISVDKSFLNGKHPAYSENGEDSKLGFGFDTWSNAGQRVEGEASSTATITPTSSANDFTDVDTTTNLFGEFIIDGPTTSTTLALDYSSTGAIRRPNTSLEGSIFSSHVLTIESVLNGNPVLSTAYSGWLAYNDQDEQPRASTGLIPWDSLEPTEDLSVDGYNWAGASTRNITVDTGQPIIVRAESSTSMFAKGYDDDGSAPWSAEYANTFALSVLEGYVIKPVESTPPQLDLDDDGDVDADDLSRLASEAIAETHGEVFDLTQDGLVNGDDVQKWLADAAVENGFAEPFLPGDTNLDGVVDSVDLNNIGLNWLDSGAFWRGGDFTLDNVVNSADLNFLGIHWRKEIPVAASPKSFVPEPSSRLPFIVIAFRLLTRRRRVSHTKRSVVCGSE